MWQGEGGGGKSQCGMEQVKRRKQRESILKGQGQRAWKQKKSLKYQWIRIAIPQVFFTYVQSSRAAEYQREERLEAERSCVVRTMASARMTHILLCCEIFPLSM